MNMDFITEGLIPIIAILSAVALPIGFGMYLALSNIRSRHKEDMELIKQGIVPPPKSASVPNRYRSLRNGFLCIGIGLGIIIGMIINSSFRVGDYEFFVMASTILVFLGLAYVLFYWITKDKDFDA